MDTANSTFTDALRAQAKTLGADLVGIAPADLPPEPGGPEAYKKWVERGMHGTMGYMARDPSQRDSIRGWWPHARSVVLLGFCHAGRPDPAPPKPGEGRFASYALTEDYHGALKARTRQLLEWIKARRPGSRGKVFVDTSPVLERLYARYAGLGWIGKNAMMISPRRGSFFFLTGLAVDLELEPDRPVTDHCGSCTRCLDACPTDAFPRPRVLDASRCIAYFTIEHRGSIPEGFREGVGDWVFGCDVCQDVCPWNRFAETGPLFGSRLIEPRQDLAELAALTPEEFERRFGPTPVERAGRQGLLRNVLLAMGNAKDPKYRPILERCAADPDPVIAEQARWSLTILDGKANMDSPSSACGSGS